MREIEAAGGKAMAVLADVGDAAAVEAMAQAALKRFGRIDILVNNASLRREKPIGEMSYADWREVMNATLDSAFHGVHACLPAMKKAGGGTIINIGGMSAHTGSKGRAHVMTAKAALVGFSRALAHDLAADRITANCVVPGAIDTTRPGSSPKPAHHLTHGTITGERGKPDDVAAMVRFLCGPGGRYVTGQTIHVSGGAYLGVLPCAAWAGWPLAPKVLIHRPQLFRVTTRFACTPISRFTSTANGSTATAARART